MNVSPALLVNAQQVCWEAATRKRRHMGERESPRTYPLNSYFLGTIGLNWSYRSLPSRFKLSPLLLGTNKDLVAGYAQPQQRSSGVRRGPSRTLECQPT